MGVQIAFASIWSQLKLKVDLEDIKLEEFSFFYKTAGIGGPKGVRANQVGGMGSMELGHCLHV